jgi:NitT/TauT family transport system substrate-binding protein
VRDPPNPDRFADVRYLQGLDKGGLFKEQQIAIAPIKIGGGSSVEANPLLSKDIRFFFEPNSSKLDMSMPENLKNLDEIKKLLQVSPGSTVVLRGHVDDQQKEDIRKKGGEPLVRSYALRAIELSTKRAEEIKQLLIDRQKVDAKRLDAVGRGWEEPVGKDSALNRRVEVQWFTLE